MGSSLGAFRIFRGRNLRDRGERETLGRLFTLDRIRVLRKSLTFIRVDSLGSHLIIGYVGNSGKLVRFSKLYWSCVAEGLGGLDTASRRACWVLREARHGCFHGHLAEF